LFSLLLLAAAAGPALDFDRVFSARGEPASLHYRARYRASGGVHQVEVWRDGDRRLKRATDGRLTTFASHRTGDAGYRLDVLDQKRHVHTTIHRDNMYRIGSFTDWFDLGHALRHPRATYRLTAGVAPRATASAAPAPCRWYDLAQVGQTSHICWDGANRLPLLIVDNAGALVWRVTALDRGRIAPVVFAIEDRGYVRTDADRDIAAD
jgi:hypothetical protein